MNRQPAPSTRHSIAARIRKIRIEFYGEHGGAFCAESLGVPVRTWQNYESGVTIPSEVMLQFLELTRVCPRWLLTGEGERYRPAHEGKPPRGRFGPWPRGGFAL